LGFELDVFLFNFNFVRYNLDNFGTIEERELVPGGKNIAVTQENK
jgi:hypothetical protein